MNNKLVFHYSQEVPTLAKAIFQEENFRSNIKVESSIQEESPAPTDPRMKSEITGQKLFALASQCKVSIVLSPTTLMIGMNEFQQEHGMSGRALRRLPVLALARYIGIGTSTTNMALSGPAATKKSKSKVNGASKNGMHGAGNQVKNRGADVAVWLDAMTKVVKDQASEHGKLS